MTALCRFCGQPGKLIKAHIIPEAFFRQLRIGDQAPIVVSTRPETLPKRAPIGVYDSEILCDQCEPKFDRFDTYGTDVLLTRKEQLFVPLLDGDRLRGYQADGIDQELLLRFLVSVLWRASVSNNAFFARVNLGAYETLAKTVISSPDLPIPSVFGAVLAHWDAVAEHKAMSNGMMDPYMAKLDGLNTYRLYLGQVIAHIKVDKRPTTGSLKLASLLTHNSVFMMVRNFEASKDFAAFQQTAIRSHLNTIQFRKKHNKFGSGDR